MRLTADETRALAFVGLLIVLSIGARLLDRPEPIALDGDGVDVAALEAASRAAKEGKGGEAVRALRPGEKIDPNTAPSAELRRLPRATRALAERIVEDRKKNGPYASLQDLDRVPGIGPVTIAAWAEQVTLPAVSSRSTTSPARGTWMTPAANGPANAAADPAGSSGSASSRTRAMEPLDLNRATAAELERLPGIGAVLAERIVAHRDSKGGFRSLDELEQVRGIGPAMLAKLKPMLRLGS